MGVAIYIVKKRSSATLFQRSSAKYIGLYWIIDYAMCGMRVEGLGARVGVCNMYSQYAHNDGSSGREPKCSQDCRVPSQLMALVPCTMASEDMLPEQNREVWEEPDNVDQGSEHDWYYAATTHG